METNDLKGYRKLPGLFDRVPLHWGRRAPSGEAVEADAFVPFLKSEGEFVGDAMLKAPESLWASGFVGSGYKELPMGNVGRFSGLDMVPPAFLDLSSWGKFLERDGVLFYVPTPREFVDLLDGKSIAAKEMYEVTGLPRRYYLAVPSLESFSGDEVSVCLGTSLTLGLSRLLEVGVKESDDESSARLVSEDLPPGKNLRTQVSKYGSGLVGNYEVITRFGDTVPSADGKTIGLGSLKGLESSFDRKTWGRFLPGLVAAWDLREQSLEKFPNLKGEESRVVGTPSGFQLDKLRFGFSVGGDVAADLEVTKTSIAQLFAPSGSLNMEVGTSGEVFVADYSRPVDGWDGRSFVFFLRCVQETVLVPLGFVTGDKCGWIRGTLNAAERGRCFPASAFFRKFPGGREGFASFLEDVYSYAGEVVRCNREEPQRDLPKALNYEFPSEVTEETKEYLSRSLGHTHSRKVSQMLPRKALKVEFPCFSAAWRVHIGGSGNWRLLPNYDLTLGGVGHYLDSLPVGDVVVDSMRAAFQSMPSSMLVFDLSWKLRDAINGYVSKVRRDMDGGLYVRPNVFEVAPLLEGGLLPSGDLLKLPSLLGGSRNTLAWYFVKKAGKIAREKFAREKLGNSLLSFRDYSVLGSPELVSFTEASAKNEVYGWYAKTGLLTDVSAGTLAQVYYELVSGPDADLLDAFGAGLDAVRKHLQAMLPPAPKLVTNLPLVLEKYRSLLKVMGACRFDDAKSACVLDLLVMLKAAPLISVGSGVLDAREREFVSRLTKVMDHNEFLEALHDFNLVPDYFCFDEVGFAAIDQALQDRQACQKDNLWRGGFALLLRDLRGPATALMAKAPFLPKLDYRFGAVNPVSLYAMHTALVSGTRLPVSMVQSFYDAVSGLSEKDNEAKAGNYLGGWRLSVCKALEIDRQVTEHARELVKQSPMFRGLAVTFDEKGYTLHGVGAAYYGAVGSRINLQSTLKYRVEIGGLPKDEAAPEVLPVLDLVNASDAMCRLYCAHPLFNGSFNAVVKEARIPSFEWGGAGQPEADSIESQPEVVSVESQSEVDSIRVPLLEKVSPVSTPMVLF
jgi:hypothetical protein